MSDDLLQIFKEEAGEYIKGLNSGLLKLELSEGEERDSLLTEMNRMAHSMKGAAGTVGYERVEKVSELLEEIFHKAIHDNLHITPGMADSLYDGIDLIEHRLKNEASDEAIVAEILSNLKNIISGNRFADTTIMMQTDSAEIHAITDEMLAVEEPAITQTSAAPGIRDTISDELLNIFWVEVEEHLGTLNTGLLNVEMTHGEERESLLKEMNRVAHSMKGAGRAVGYETIETISHHMEEILEQALGRQLDITPHVADILYDGLDLIKEVVNGNPLSEEVIAAVLMQMNRISNSSEHQIPILPLKAGDPVPPANETPEMEIPPSLMTSRVEAISSPTMLLRPAEDSLRVSVSKLDQMMADTSELLTTKLQGENQQRMLSGLQRDMTKWQREWRNARSSYIQISRRLQENPDSMTPEMTAIFRFLENNEDFLTRSNRELARLHQVSTQNNMHLSSLADQLQSNVSSLRMMPFETIVGGFQRVARDVARDIGKQLHLEIRGVSVEIDKTVLEALKDPLMHLLRNAIDHGLEDPKTRLQQDKPPIGRVLLEVQQRGSEITIKVEDDGYGFDVSRIRRKALERDLITTQEAKTLTDEDIRMLVFHSGLTTTERVTALSGRGLGMDIVRTRVENLRGRVAIDSIPGKGTAITIHVPVSLTRLSVVRLRLGDEYYAVPSNMVERMETFPIEDIFTAEGNEMLNINGRPMPLVSLGSILDSPLIDRRQDQIQVIALGTAERSIAFEVDQLFNEIELVLKPPGRELVNAPFVAGAAILGSGDIIIVLDANDLVRKASGLSFKSHQRPMVRSSSSEIRPLRILVVDDSITTRTLEKNILESVGFEVHVAIDGTEAWTRMSEINPDVIVCDVEMPNMNGLELTRLLKGTPETRDIPVILLTSLGKPEQREAGLSAGADAYLIKSRFDQDELLEVIQNLI